MSRVAVFGAFVGIIVGVNLALGYEFGFSKMTIEQWRVAAWAILTMAGNVEAALLAWTFSGDIAALTKRGTDA